MMTKKVYIAVADILRKAPMANDTRALLIDEFAEMFRRDNPNFNGARFSLAVWEGHNR